MLIVSSRAREIRFPGRSSKVVALVPVLDMANDGLGMDSPLTDLIDSTLEAGWIRFSNTDPIHAGDQVLLRDGPCTTSVCLMLNHGVLPPSMPLDFITLNVLAPDDLSVLYLDLIREVSLEESQNEELLKKKASILSQNHLNVAQLGPAFVEGTVSVFRILCATEEDIQRLIDSQSFALTHKPMSDAVETCAEYVLTELIRETLRAFPTSLQVCEPFLFHNLTDMLCLTCSMTK
jgi:hypothetical protein